MEIPPRWVNPPSRAAPVAARSWRLSKDDGDPPRFVGREHLCLHRLHEWRLAVDVGDLPVGVADDITVRRLVGAPGRQEAA